MSSVLFRKLRRDLWRQRWQFTAVSLVIAIGVMAYVGTSDAYVNLRESFDRAYASQRLPDVVLSGPGAGSLAGKASSLPGRPLVETRQQGDVGLRIGGQTLLGRAVGVPEGRQPRVSRLALQLGSLPGPGEVTVEQHLAEHYDLRPGDSLQVLGPGGWHTLLVSGAALSTEYFWPARSRQEVMTTPEHFGVVFLAGAEARALLPHPVDQVLLYASDRSRVTALTAAATALARARGLQVMASDEQPSFQTLDEDVRAVGEFADLLPWVFLTAAALGTYVLLSRLVAAQRAVIGTLVANGLGERAIRRHYLGYGIAAGVLGVVPGAVGGVRVGAWFTTAYTSALSLPLHVTSLHPASLLTGAAVGVLAAGAAAWAPARAASRTSPAEAMRITPPAGRGGRSLVERLVPPLRRLPARWRMTLRGLARNRRRTVLTVLGVAVSVSVVMVFAGLRDTVSTLIERQYGQIQLEDAEVHTASGTALPGVLHRLRADPAVTAAEPFARYDVTLSGPGGHLLTLLSGLERGTAMHRFAGLDGRSLELPRTGLLLGVGARSVLGVDIGDRVRVAVTPAGRPLWLPVAGFVDEPLNPVAYASLHVLRHVVAVPPATSGALVTVESGADTAAVAQRALSDPGVVAFLATDTVEQAMTETFSLYDTLVTLMLLFAALMAAALLYNAMSANVAERAVELGTLQGAGMGSGMLARMVATENLLLVLAGLPPGLLLGTWLADWLLSRFETQGYHWSLSLSATTPAAVAGAILGAAVVAQAPTLRAVRHMDLARVVRERSL